MQKFRFFVEHLAKHRLRVEQSATNEMVIATGKNYPKSFLITVIATSPINPQEELVNELKKFSKHFRRLHSTNIVPSPGERWMN